MRHRYLYLHTFEVFSNMFHVFLRSLNQRFMKKTSTETIHSKSSQVICTRSSDTAGGPSASQSPWSVQKIKNMLHQTCFSPWKLEKSSFCPHIFVWRGPFLFVEWLLMFFQRSQISKIRRALFRFPGFSWPRRGGHFIVVCPTFATTNGSSKFSASWDEKKNSMWDMGKFCGSCVLLEGRGSFGCFFLKYFLMMGRWWGEKRFGAVGVFQKSFQEKICWRWRLDGSFIQNVFVDIILHSRRITYWTQTIPSQVGLFNWRVPPNRLSPSWFFFVFRLQKGEFPVGFGIGFLQNPNAKIGSDLARFRQMFRSAHVWKLYNYNFPARELNHWGTWLKASLIQIPSSSQELGETVDFKTEVNIWCGWNTPPKTNMYPK